jgi:hypothetical protein
VGRQGDGDAPQPRVATVPLGQDAVDPGKPYPAIHNLPIPFWILDVVAPLAGDAAICPRSCATRGAGLSTLLRFLLTLSGYRKQWNWPPSLPCSDSFSRNLAIGSNGIGHHLCGGQIRGTPLVLFAMFLRPPQENYSFNHSIRHVRANDSLEDPRDAWISNDPSVEPSDRAIQYWQRRILLALNRGEGEEGYQRHTYPRHTWHTTHSTRRTAHSTRHAAHITCHAGESFLIPGL